ncbi:hypothetical protein [Spirobacillus cienkowskii]|uniref:hypothetical protein n=1 Tax=Spirobacillus cienkowskii TaxID=495820 RepID=UPI0030D54BD1
MDRIFVVLNGFWEDWQRLGLDDKELNFLELELMKNPLIGDIIQGSKGVRKVRWSVGNKGKRGGVRIFYLDITATKEVYLLAVIAKNEKANLTKSEINILAKLVNNLKKED